MTRPCRLLTATAALALALIGCADDTAGDDAAPGTAGQDDAEDTAGTDQASDGAVGEGLTVVAPVYPLAWVAERLAPAADVELLTDTGDDPHDMELSPRDRGLLEAADVVAHMGEIGYQPQVEAATREAAGEVVSFAEIVGEDAMLAWEDDGDHDHDHDEGGEIDPHAWFDAALMAEFAEGFGDALATVDEGGADAYRERAAGLAQELRDADARIGGFFEDCAHDRVIVSHEAYAYLVEPHGLRQEGISGTGGHGPASPQRIAVLVQQVRDEGIGHVLAEPVEGRQDATALAEEAGVEVLDIHSLEVVDGEGTLEGRGFLELLVEQAETASRALDCD